MSEITTFKRDYENIQNSFGYELCPLNPIMFFKWEDSNDTEYTVVLNKFKNNIFAINTIRLNFKEDVNDITEVFDYDSVDEFNQYIKEMIDHFLKNHNETEVPVILN